MCIYRASTRLYMPHFTRLYMPHFTRLYMPMFRDDDDEDEDEDEDEDDDDHDRHIHQMTTGNLVLLWDIAQRSLCPVGDHRVQLACA